MDNYSAVYLHLQYKHDKDKRGIVMQIDYLDIGSRIRTERLKQNIPQEKLAEMVGCGTTHISHIETGNTKASIKILIAIINALNISADELLRNHIGKVKHILDGELAEIMQDCNDDETRIIADTIKALKIRLRRNTKK
jgi:transcriptional regulator with XRE-family HTH domain